jgi:hypothetical protein
MILHCGRTGALVSRSRAVHSESWDELQPTPYPVAVSAAPRLASKRGARTWGTPDLTNHTGPPTHALLHYFLLSQLIDYRIVFNQLIDDFRNWRPIGATIPRNGTGLTSFISITYRLGTAPDLRALSSTATDQRSTM